MSDTAEDVPNHLVGEEAVDPCPQLEGEPAVVSEPLAAVTVDEATQAETGVESTAPTGTSPPEPEDMMPKPDVALGDQDEHPSVLCTQPLQSEPVPETAIEESAVPRENAEDGEEVQEAKEEEEGSVQPAIDVQEAEDPETLQSMEEPTGATDQSNETIADQAPDVKEPTAGTSGPTQETQETQETDTECTPEPHETENENTPNGDATDSTDAPNGDATTDPDPQSVTVVEGSQEASEVSGSENPSESPPSNTDPQEAADGGGATALPTEAAGAGTAVVEDPAQDEPAPDAGASASEAPAQDDSASVSASSTGENAAQNPEQEEAATSAGEREGSESGSSVTESGSPATASQQLSRPDWVPDSHSDRCSYCYERFTVRLRRHHCRCCGLVVCFSCLCTSSPPVPSHFLTVKDRAKAALGTNPPICIWCGPVLTSNPQAEADMSRHRIGRVHMCIQPRQLTPETSRQMFQITGGRHCLWLFNPHLAASSQGLDVIRGVPTAQVTMPRGTIVLHLKRFLLEAMRYMNDAEAAAHMDTMAPEDLSLEISLTVSGECLPDNKTLGEIEWETLEGATHSRILVKYELNMSREERDQLVRRVRNQQRTEHERERAVAAEELDASASVSASASASEETTESSASTSGPDTHPGPGYDTKPKASSSEPAAAEEEEEEEEEEDESMRCTICYDSVETFTPGQQYCTSIRPGTVLVCGHVFHLDCLGSFFNAVGSGAMTCPNCRQQQPGMWRLPTPESD